MGAVVVCHKPEGRGSPLMGGHGRDTMLMKLGPGVQHTRFMGKRLQHNKKGLAERAAKSLNVSNNVVST